MTGGTTIGDTTCTSSDSGHTPQPNADASKRYANGKTAAQIAVSHGGSGYLLTGPGNSQPHKVTACGKPGNKSGGVDVHAVKSYLSADCAQAPTQVAATAQADGRTGDPAGSCRPGDVCRFAGCAGFACNAESDCGTRGPGRRRWAATQAQ